MIKHAFILLLLFSFSNTTFAQPAVDTLKDAGCRVYKLPLSAITIVSSNDGSPGNLYINIPLLPFPEKDEDDEQEKLIEYRFLLDHPGQPTKFTGYARRDKEDIFVEAFLDAYGRNNLYLNGKLFTGFIKLYCNDYWYDIARTPSPSLKLKMHEYNNGTLLETFTVDDVSSVCTETPRDRPSL